MRFSEFHRSAPSGYGAAGQRAPLNRERSQVRILLVTRDRSTMECILASRGGRRFESYRSLDAVAQTERQPLSASAFSRTQEKGAGLNPVGITTRGIDREARCRTATPETLVRIQDPPLSTPVSTITLPTRRREEITRAWIAPFISAACGMEGALTFL